MNNEFQNFIESLTPEQYIKIVEIAHGPLPEDIKNLTDDELLAGLGV